jgi:hypothetical protein
MTITVQFYCRWEKILAKEKKKGSEHQKQIGGQASSKTTPKTKPNGSGGHGGAHSGGGPGGVASRGGQMRPPPARFNGLSVCFGYNTISGCSRTKHNQNSCVDSVNPGVIYAHVCNWYTKPASGQQGPGTYCFATHPRYQGGH